MNKRILSKWLKSGVVDMGQVKQTEEGTPQGGIISPTLANMTLDGMEALLTKHFGVIGNRQRRANKVFMVRYADDFIISGSSKEILEDEVIPRIREFLKERGLTLSERKTQIVHIEQGFDFLGWTVRSFKGKLLIKPNRKNVETFYRKVKETISAMKMVKPEILIAKLNPMIRGWVNYHRHVVAKKTFSKVDHLVWRAIWRWCCRRHSNRRKRFVKAKYFTRTASRDWIFGVHTLNRYGDKIWVELLLCSQTAIKRHIKVKSDYNPFLPEWELYGETLYRKRMYEHYAHRSQWQMLYKEQKGRCGLCHLPITKETGWHDHHIIYRIHGGNNTLKNRVLLHPVCHTKVHALKLEVLKPT